MILSDKDIIESLGTGQLELDPWEPELLQPASIDVRLMHLFRVFNAPHFDHINPAIDQQGLTSLIDIPAGEPLTLQPGEFVLGSTLERVRLSTSICGRFEGKSSLGRLGLIVHSTAGFIDPGFNGNITVELTNISGLPIKLWPGMKIGQLCLLAMKSPSLSAYGARGYGSHYQGQVGPTESQAWKGFRTWKTR